MAVKLYVKKSNEYVQVETLDDETVLSTTTAVPKVEYNGFKNTSGGKLSLKKPLESWRTDTTPFYFYKASINGYEQISYLRDSSLPLIGNNTTNRLFATTSPGTTTIKAVSNGLQFGGTTVQTRDRTTPNFVIFELQGAGGGGGGTDSKDSRNGSGGGGGGYITGILKLDFIRYSYYKIVVGTGGAGGVGSDTALGKDGETSKIIGVQSNGTEVTLVEARGGKGGRKANANTWTSSTAPAAGGSTYITEAANFYGSIKCASSTDGGRGGTTNNTSCTVGGNFYNPYGRSLQAKRFYYTEDEIDSTGLHVDRASSGAGDPGSSYHSGGGGAAYGILGYQGKGGNGGGDASDGEAGKFGAGGGGGRWTLFNTPKNGGKGGDGCCAIYY